MDGYDGILLLGQFPNHDILYYFKNLPVFRCLESDRRMQDLILESALNSYTAQKSTDLLLSKATWITDWLSDYGVDSTEIHTISEGINVVEPIGKELSKQHTAELTDNPLFAQLPVVGIISGFEPNAGMQRILEIATKNPHLAFLVYDSILADAYRNTLSNLVIFSASDEATRSVLPIFFQALDVVCFPAVPGTSPSLVLEAMAYGTPAVVISKYRLPSEIQGGRGTCTVSRWKRKRVGNSHSTSIRNYKPITNGHGTTGKIWGDSKRIRSKIYVGMHRSRDCKAV